MKWFNIFAKILVGLLLFPITFILLFIWAMKKVLDWLFAEEH
ncbi:MAG: hypothetical protein NDF57_05200 [archaeon GBS-70-058]|nr:hypothetical protein [Candidatus Culexarchaeum nevadense]